MYLNNVIIQNYKAIEHMELTFRQGINIIIGDNGVGKTSILEAIAIGLGGYLSCIPGISSKGILQADIRIMSNAMAGASSSLSYMTPVEITCTINDNEDMYRWTRKRSDETSKSRTKTTNSTIANYANRIVNSPDSQLPVLSYFSTARISSSKREDFGASLKKKLNDRRCGYIGCMDSTLDVKAIKAWCLKMEMEAFQQARSMPEYEAFKSIVSSVMTKMGELDNAPKVSYSRQFEDIVYSERDETLPISYLSAGYQSLLWISMDIAHRLALLNPNCDDLSHISGIVLIDELDMHLHPKWQWNVLRTLEETFPNIQFIIATHSPILISSCKNEHLINIDFQHIVTYPDAAYAYSIEDVVKSVQGSSDIPKEVRDMYLKFDFELTRGNIEEAKDILKRMEDAYGLDNREVKIAQSDLLVESLDFEE